MDIIDRLGMSIGPVWTSGPVPTAPFPTHSMHKSQSSGNMTSKGAFQLSLKM